MRSDASVSNGDVDVVAVTKAFDALLVRLHIMEFSRLGWKEALQLPPATALTPASSAGTISSDTVWSSLIPRLGMVETVTNEVDERAAATSAKKSKQGSAELPLREWGDRWGRRKLPTCCRETGITRN